MSNVIKLHFPQMEGKRIYHYTSENGLLGIMQKGKIVLQLTKADSVNDTTEGIEIFEHLLKVCRKLLRKGIVDQAQHDEIISLKNAAKKEYPTTYFTGDYLFFDMKDSDVYIMSFCKNNDSLPMWKYYANSGQQGYSLHFNQDKFNDYILHKDSGIYIGFVIYSNKQKEKIISDIITSSISQRNYLRTIEDSINEYQYFFKHTAFKDENEIRLMITLPKTTDKPTFETKFKMNRGHLVPYIEWEITQQSDSEMHMFLVNGITIGPLANKELANRNMSLFLNERDYPIASMKIENSQIPIRF